MQLKSKNEFASKNAWRRVEEVAKAIAVQVVLNIAGIKMVEQVEDAESQLHGVFLAAEWNLEFSEHLKIERIEFGVPLVVSWTDKISLLVYDRIGKTVVNVEYRHQGQLPRRCELAPRQKTIGRVESQGSASIRLDHRLRIITEELVEIVQIACGSRAHVRSVQRVVMNPVSTGYLKLAIKISSAVGQR